MNPNPYGGQYGASQGYGQSSYNPQGGFPQCQAPASYQQSGYQTQTSTTGVKPTGEYIMGGVQPTTCPLPTLKPNLNTDLSTDVNNLKNAFEGEGCNEKVIVEILCRRTSVQREKIKSEYIKLFQKSLYDRLKKELFEPMDKIAVSLMHTGPDLDSYYIRKATKGPCIDSKMITHIMVTRSHQQICLIKESYSKRYQKSLFEVFTQQLACQYKDAIMLLLNNARQDRDTNSSLASQQATTIYTRNTPQSGTDPRSRILCQSSYEQIVTIANSFQTQYHQPIEVFLSAFGGGYEELLLAICTYSLNPSRYFAKELKNCITEKDIKKVIMIITSRCEVDLGNILNEYVNMYGSKPEADLQSAFSDKGRPTLDSLMILMGIL